MGSREEAGGFQGLRFRMGGGGARGVGFRRGGCRVYGIRVRTGGGGVGWKCEVGEREEAVTGARRGGGGE